ncbi:MAG: histidine kinase [Lachnospiraceae bacterium]|nr:histidine kinase [Lachnospiraceae bacterium]
MKKLSDIHMERKNKSAKPRTLKSSLVIFVLGCWLVPISLFLLFTIFFYQKAYVDKNERLIRDSIANAAYLASVRLEEDIRVLQKPSYERDWEKEWISMKKGNISQKEFINDIKESLKTKYYSDKKFDLYAFYLEGVEEPPCYSSRIGFSYNDFQKEASPIVEKIRVEDTNYVQIRVIQNKVYIIRNLYTVSSYKKYGTLVVALNSDKIFDGFVMEHPENIALVFNTRDELLFPNADMREDNTHARKFYANMLTKLTPRGNYEYTETEDAGYVGYTYQIRTDNYNIAILYPAKKTDVYATLYKIYETVGIFFLLLIPFMFLTVYFLRIQVEEPVDELIELSKRISEGNLGTTSHKQMPNQELSYLLHSVNDMSTQLDYLFNSVYSEKLLRKDAQIMALQAQINPHFLNNTLEIMNWQARMSEDITVCKMIESLGTVLDHTMNRDNKKEVYLSEELRCVDAYLYIMSMRFGQRLQIERMIDESLLWINVPQLILQPIIENAILHGIERAKSGIITIHVHHDKIYTYLDVINTGKEISEEKIKKIQQILEDESMIPERNGKHTSIGVRNVNSRIKLVYGDEYGLQISLLPDKRFLSRILIPYRNTEK